MAEEKEEEEEEKGTRSLLAASRVEITAICKPAAVQETLTNDAS
jgi:hypothetical protein